MTAMGQTRSSDDVRCMTGLPLKAEVRPRVCYVAEVPEAAIAAIRGTGLMEYQADSSGSLQFDPRKLDHLGPFLSIRGYEFSELVGRHRH